MDAGDAIHRSSCIQVEGCGTWSAPDEEGIDVERRRKLDLPFFRRWGCFVVEMFEQIRRIRRPAESARSAAIKFDHFHEDASSDAQSSGEDPPFRTQTGIAWCCAASALTGLRPVRGTVNSRINWDAALACPVRYLNGRTRRPELAASHPVANCWELWGSAS